MDGTYRREEFTILLPEPDHDRALDLSRRLIDIVREPVYPYAEPEGRQTASMAATSIYFFILNKNKSIGQPHKKEIHMKRKDANIANSIFPGFNDKHGIMFCGYEWGYDKEDQEADRLQAEPVASNSDIKVTFANKEPMYGDSARRWKYDNTIMTWFELWGHPLNRENEGDFEKTIIQTNWCRSQAPNMGGEIKKKLRDEQNRENFLSHIEAFEPSVLFLFGSEMIEALQRSDILNRFKSVMGTHETPTRVQKDGMGTRFVISFQKFEKCNVISLPHPSGSRGLRNDYIKSFADEIGGIISEYRAKRSI